jgi:seryl-tRNA synthetase
MDKLRMDAYYYGFDETGVKEIDLILSAVACAGKAFHHTQEWNEDASPYEGHTGATPALWIQHAAQQAADAIATLTRERDAAVRECVRYQQERDAIAKRFENALAEGAKRREERDAAIARAEAAEKEKEDFKKAAIRQANEIIQGLEAINGGQAESLRALLRVAELVIKLLFNTPEIADCDPRDKDTETQIAERKARDLAARITAATQTETGGEDE